MQNLHISRRCWAGGTLAPVVLGVALAFSAEAQALLGDERRWLALHGVADNQGFVFHADVSSIMSRSFAQRFASEFGPIAPRWTQQGEYITANGLDDELSELLTTDTFLRVGYGPGARGVLSVLASNTTLGVFVGETGHGTLLINNPRLLSELSEDVHHPDFTIDFYTSQLEVGSFGGVGAVVVSAGSELRVNQGVIGGVHINAQVGFGGTGTVLVDGGRLTNYARLVLGESQRAGGGEWTAFRPGQGSLTIRNGGIFFMKKEVVLGQNLHSVGTINIGASAAESAQSPGSVDVYPSPGGAKITFGSDDGGNGHLVFNHTSSAYTFAPALQSRGAGLHTIQQLAGHTTLTGNSSGFTGQIHINGGQLTVNGRLGGSLSVNSGTLSGRGTVGAVAVHNGTLAVNDRGLTLGSLYLGPAARLQFGLGPSNTFGQLTIKGDLTLDGTLHLDPLTSSQFGLGSYHLLSYDGALTDNGLALGALPGEYAYELSRTPGQIALLASARPIVPVTPVDPVDPIVPVIPIDPVDPIAPVTQIDPVDLVPPSVAPVITHWNPVDTTWGADTALFDAHGNAVASSAGFVLFSGAPASIALANPSGAVAPPGMQFIDHGYHLTGDALVPSNTGTTVRVGNGSVQSAGHVAVFDNALAGSGKLIKSDYGTLRLTADSSGFTGISAVHYGTLAVDGLLGGAVEVSRGGLLAGTGTLTGTTTLKDGGVFTPGLTGTSPNTRQRHRSASSVHGTTTVNDLVFERGSILRVDADATGASDHVAVTGAVAIKPGAVVEVMAAQGDWRPRTEYQLLTTQGAGTLSGRFDSVTSNLAFLEPSLRYGTTESGGQNVWLTLARNQTQLVDIATTPNQAAVATGLASLGPDSPLHDSVLGLNRESARAAYNQLSGELHASAQGQLLDSSDFIRQPLLDRLRQANQGVALDDDLISANDAQGLSVWSKSSHRNSDRQGEDGTAGLRRSLSGTVLGIDSLLANDWRLGVAGGYSEGSLNLDHRQASGKVDSYHLGLYAGRQFNALDVHLGVAYSGHHSKNKRTVHAADAAEHLKSDYWASTRQAFGEIGYRLSTSLVRVEPFVSLAYVQLDRDGFDEQGGLTALRAVEETSSMRLITAGLRAEREVQVLGRALTTSGAVGLRRANGDLNSTAELAFEGGAPMRIQGAPVARTTTLMDVGLSFRLSSTARLGLAYAGQYARDSREHGMSAELSWVF